MNLSVILPIHEFDEEIGKFLKNAVMSIQKQIKLTAYPELLIVLPKSLEDKVSEYLKTLDDLSFEIKIILNEGKTDFQSQVNLGVSECKTPYFSILEFDDEYSTTFIHNSEKYTSSYPEVDIFLSMMIEVNDKNEGLKLTNEVVWAQQFVGENGEMGFLNQNCMKQTTDFKISGSIIKKDEFLNLGGLKSNIELTFNQEFLLRALNNACKIYTIPKIGYKHLATRVGSLFDFYLKNMPVNERKFWFDVAMKEYNFMNDRIIDKSKLRKLVVEK